jgi:preprotein translocase subunit SecG
MYVLLIGLIVLAAILMCLVVLAQNSKGGGLSSSFASSNQIMGVRKTTDFIEKLTWGLAAFMVVCSVLTAYFIPSVQTEKSVIMEEAVKESATNPLNQPAGFDAPAADNAQEGAANAAPAGAAADSAAE